MANPAYRVFLGHSSKDKDFVRELYRRLTCDGVSCFFDIESIGWGQNRVRALERALDECEYVVLVLSPDFCNSELAEVERTSSIADDPGALKHKLRPLMLRPCRDLPTFPRFLRPVQDIDVSTPENFETNYPRICQELGGIPLDGTKAGQVPFWVEGPRHDFLLYRKLFGYDLAHSGNLFAHSVFSVLSKIDLPDSVYRPYFIRTVSDLGEPELAKAETLFEMLQELSSLQDEATTGKVPYGLLQFMVRLSDRADLKIPVDAWLDESASEQKNDLANIKEKIAVENQVMILLIEVENEQGRISAFEAYLRTNDLARPIGPTLPYQLVESWQDFCEKIRNIIEKLRSDSIILDFEIHFLADPPLFSNAFHQISLRSGCTLGEEFVVILRHRERVRRGRPTIVKPWKEYAAALRPVKPSELTIHGVSNGVSLDHVLERKGLCYTEFVVSEMTLDAGHSHDIHLLLKLLRLGVPYFYLLHRVQKTPGWPEALGKVLRNWLKELTSLDRLPSALRERRTTGSPFASDGTLLWDDPEFIPFFPTTEVSIK